MSPPEFVRAFPVETIGTTPRAVEIAADAGECAALATRLGLARLNALTAKATLIAVAGGIDVTGKLHAEVEQICVVTGDALPVIIDEPFVLRFVAASLDGAEEVELGQTDLDVLPLDDGALDLGEAVAQTLGLALDPFPRSPLAGDDEQVWRAGPDASPFAGLKGLLG